MAFFHRLIAEIERKRHAQPVGFQQLIAELERKRYLRPQAGDYFAFRQESGATAQQINNVPKEVRQFAPKKLRRQHQTGEVRSGRLNIEIELWRDRAIRAETRLRDTGKLIQHVAADSSIPTPTRGTDGS